MQNTHNDLQKPIDVTGVILAGGRSTRMGRDKATLEVAGETLFGRILAMMRSVFSRLLISGGWQRPLFPAYPISIPAALWGSARRIERRYGAVDFRRPL